MLSFTEEHDRTPNRREFFESDIHLLMSAIGNGIVGDIKNAGMCVSEWLDPEAMGLGGDALGGIPGGVQFFPHA